jgi:hypothetical protein
MKIHALKKITIKKYLLKILQKKKENLLKNRLLFSSQVMKKKKIYDFKLYLIKNLLFYEIKLRIKMRLK